MNCDAHETPASEIALRPSRRARYIGLGESLQEPTVLVYIDGDNHCSLKVLGDGIFVDEDIDTDLAHVSVADLPRLAFRTFPRGCDFLNVAHVCGKEEFATVSVD